ncbi:MAG: hypothetical protein LBB40_05600 [Holophagales bacterium]|nr:hypothetical protein [Holophagales bacterium]
MRHKLIHLSRIAALSLAAICAPCLRAEERGTLEFKVKPPLALSADETLGIKWKEPASSVFRQAIKDEDTPITNEPPGPPLWIYVYGGGWTLFNYLYRVNINDLYEEIPLDIFGGQPPYTITLANWIPLYAATGSVNGYVWSVPNYSPPGQPNLICQGSIVKEPNSNKPYDFTGFYWGEGKVTVSDAAGNYAEAPFIVRIRLY